MQLKKPQEHFDYSPLGAARRVRLPLPCPLAVPQGVWEELIVASSRAAPSVLHCRIPTDTLQVRDWAHGMHVCLSFEGVWNVAVGRWAGLEV